MGIKQLADAAMKLEKAFKEAQALEKVAKEKKPALPLDLTRAKPKTKQEITKLADRVARQQSGEFIRKSELSGKADDTANLAGRSGKEVERLKDLDYTLERTKNIRPTPTYESEVGDINIAIPGDQTIADYRLVDVNGRPIDSTQQGGSMYGEGKLDLDDPLFWASEEGIAQMLQDKITELAKLYNTDRVTAYHLAMGQDANNFAMHFADANLKAIANSDLSPEAIEIFNAAVREGPPHPKTGKKIPMPHFAGIENPEEAYMQMLENPMLRKWFNNRMKVDKYTTKVGLPSGKDIQWAITEPALRNMEINLTGHSVGRMKPFAELTDTADHVTYGKGIQGESLGRAPELAPFEMSFPDADLYLRSVYAPSDLTGTMQKVFPHQIVDQQQLDQMSEYYRRLREIRGFKEGGEVDGPILKGEKAKQSLNEELSNYMRQEDLTTLLQELARRIQLSGEMSQSKEGTQAFGRLGYRQPIGDDMNVGIGASGHYSKGEGYKDAGIDRADMLLSKRFQNDSELRARLRANLNEQAGKRGLDELRLEYEIPFKDGGSASLENEFRRADIITSDPQYGSVSYYNDPVDPPRFGAGGGISQKDLVSAGKSAYKQLNVPNPKSPFDIAVTQRQPVKGAKQAIINLGEEFKKLQDPQNAFNAMLGTIAPVEGAAKATVNFVSSVERAIKGHKMESMNGEQWANWMRANASKSAKKEAEATGLYDWLKSQGKVSKAEIEAYVEGNLPQIQEKTFGMTMKKLNPTQLSRLAYLEKENAKAPLGAIDDVLGEGAYEEMITLQNIRDKSTVDKLYEAQPELERKANIAQQRGDIELAKKYWDEVSHLSARAEHLDLRGAGLEDTTKFGQYTEPGGENYQEIAYSLPRKPMKLSEFEREFMPGAKDQEKVKRAYEEYLQNPSRYSWADTYRVPSGHTYGDDVADMNRLLHLRTNERLTPEGKRALFLEELQSDWAQKARKHGIKKDITDEDLRQYHESVRKDTDPAWEDLPSNDRAFLRHILENRQTEAVPEGPYITDTKDWTALGLKQALKKAIDEGHDVLAWTTGAQQADRYKLSKYLENVRAVKTPEGTYSFYAYEKGADRGNLPTIAQHNLTEDELSEHLGKDMAQKIVNDLAEAKPSQVANYDNIDLQLGGEGMKGYYDQIVPQTMNDILKQYGIKDGVKEIAIGPVGKSYDDIIKELGDWDKYPRGSAEREALVRQLDTAPDVGHTEYAGTHLGIEITPELREKIFNEGLSYFKRGGEVNLEEEFRKADMIEKKPLRAIPQSVISALDKGRKLSPIEKKLAGTFGVPENQWKLGSILEEFDPVFTAGRGIEALKNVDYGAIGDLALQRYQLAKNPRKSIEKGLENLGEATFGALDVAPAGALLTKPARKAVKGIYEQLKLPENMPAGMSIKPVGGQWFPRGVASELEDVKMADTESPVNKAVNAWVDGTLRKYLMNRMGTESDEVRKLFDEGIHHVDPSNLNFSNYLEDIEANRRNNYYGREHAKTSRGRAWEYASDSAIFPRVAGNLGSHIKETYPWINKLPPEEKIYALSSNMENHPDVMRNLGFDHVIDVLKSDILEGKLRPEQLNKVSVEDAIKRTHNYNIEMAKKAEEAGIMTQQGLPVHREYPEGYKWVELKYSEPKGKFPEGFEVSTVDYGNGEKRYFATTPLGRSAAYKTEKEAIEELERNTKDLKDFREKVKTEEALRYEGDTMGHCVGSYCEDVMGGGTRIFSLRDAEGKPHVTIEVTAQDAPAFYDMNKHHFESNPELQRYAEFINDTSSSEAEFIDDVTRKMKEMGIEPVIPEPSYKIQQIKGKGNAKPADKYIPYVQDFVKNPVVDKNWADVGDFRNTDLIDVRAMREHGVLPDMDTEGTNQILQEIDRLYPTAKTPTGGLVFENEYGRLIPNTDMLKYEVQDLPSPYLTKEDIIEHLRKREPRSVEQSYSKYWNNKEYEDSKKLVQDALENPDHPANFANGGYVDVVPFPRDN